MSTPHRAALPHTLSYVLLILLFAALAIVILPPSANAATTAWTIKKDAWTTTDEKNYSDFITALGTSGCNTVDKCFRSSANPYRGSDPSDISFHADCGRFPYALRAYFAWKNNLPFGYVNSVDAAEGLGNDLRYSPKGNVVTSRISITQKSASGGVNGISAIKTMLEDVNTAMFRVHPSRDGADTGKFPDYYSAKISRADVRPGTVVYDPNGHVVVVYKVEADGRVRIFDSHPDQTISHGVYGEKFARSSPGSGAGFKNFRPLKLTGATKGSKGEYIGGSIKTIALKDQSGYSVEQFFGTEQSAPYKDEQWKKARFKVSGNEMKFTDFVRTRLAIGELKYHPVEEMKNAMEALCGDIVDRVTAVNGAITAGIMDKSHPSNLPNNIYGTSGEWEEFSTPSRDARLKTSFRELRDRVEEMVEMYKKHDPRIDYPGSDLDGDLRAAYQASADACTVSYVNSNGKSIKLDYDDVVNRLFKLSFDPYNCIELRWGATSQSELATCADSTSKRKWYLAEQRLRNQLDRVYDAKMGFSLQDLIDEAPGSGVDTPPDVDLRGYLDSL